VRPGLDLYARSVTDVNLAPIADDDLAAWIDRARDDYRASLERSGRSADDAREKAYGDWEGLFPGGRRQDGHHVMRIVADGAPAGWIWVGPAPQGAGVEWWLWDVFVEERLRGQGVASEAIGQAEALGAELGIGSMGLNVHGYNTTARSLYERLGYTITAVQMRKDFGPPQ
jgi:GNAT superfamily N-acetyltransferase